MPATRLCVLLWFYSCRYVETTVERGLEATKQPNQTIPFGGTCAKIWMVCQFEVVAFAKVLCFSTTIPATYQATFQNYNFGQDWSLYSYVIFP